MNIQFEEEQKPVEAPVETKPIEAPVEEEKKPERKQVELTMPTMPTISPKVIKVIGIGAGAIVGLSVCYYAYSYISAHIDKALPSAPVVTKVASEPKPVAPPKTLKTTEIESYLSEKCSGDEMMRVYNNYALKNGKPIENVGSLAFGDAIKHNEAFIKTYVQYAQTAVADRYNPLDVTPACKERIMSPVTITYAPTPVVASTPVSAPPVVASTPVSAPPVVASTPISEPPVLMDLAASQRSFKDYCGKLILEGFFKDKPLQKTFNPWPLWEAVNASDIPDAKCAQSFTLAKNGAWIANFDQTMWQRPQQPKKPVVHKQATTGVEPCISCQAESFYK